jgi:hypothetical protein
MRKPDTLRIICLATALFTGCATASVRQARLTELDAPGLAARIQGDLRSVRVYREGLRSILQFMDRRADLFPRATLRRSRVLGVEDREIVRKTYQTFLDYQLALGSIGRYHRDFYRLGGVARRGSFLAVHGAFLAQYRFSLEFLERVDRDPGFAVFLNESVPELGLPPKSLASLRYRFLHVARATEFVALNTMYTGHNFASSAAGGNVPDGYEDLVRSGLLEERYRGDWERSIAGDTQYVWKAAKWSGPAMTVQNALDIVRRAGATAWMPVQAGVAEWMGDTKVYRPGRPLIQPAQIAKMVPELEPGDVLLQRREWYLSNIGLPGFWSHAALYIGTPEERRQYFDSPAVRAWVRSEGARDGDIETLLARRHPEAYRQSLKPFHETHGSGESGPRPVRVLEAISEGVTFTSLEHSAAADSIAVLRPRLSRVQMARAVVHAFRYAGRPYDFDFDFQTDRQLVCTELVYRAYEQGGLPLPLVRILGRPTLPANEFVRLFDRQHGTADQRFDLVLFLDGQESRSEAVPRDLSVFRQSWKRPKWHILLQDEAARLPSVAEKIRPAG